MNQEDYFKKSKQEKLPNRCPLVGYCERYAYTIYSMSELYKYGKGDSMEEKLRSYGYLSEDYESKKNNQIGEPFEMTKSENTCGIRNGCPEVPLFDQRMIFPFIPNKAVVEGFWDNFWKENKFDGDGKFKIHKTKHYSECAEFSKYFFENKPIKRKVIPPQMYVYLMRNNLNGYYKIGISGNPKFREKTLQSQEPDVELLEFWTGEKSVEKMFHDKFHDKRLRGEWFNLSEEDVLEIIKLMEAK